MPETQNPGSAFGEAIGAAMEVVLNRLLAELVIEHDCLLISRGQTNPKTLKATKLLLHDESGTSFNIDAVIANSSLQPLVLIEYKYIRYKKHNRDKGSWICFAHNVLRQRYSSVRSSIAILAGSWSKTSLAMMKSRDINVFLIPFDRIVQLLKAHDIQFDWGEKERDIAVDAWIRYNLLTDAEKIQIAERMIEEVREPLRKLLALTLDDSVPREIDEVAVELHTNIGELKRFEFSSIDASLQFLEDFSFDEMFDTSSAPTLFSLPVTENDEEDN